MASARPRKAIPLAAQTHPHVASRENRETDLEGFEPRAKNHRHWTGTQSISRLQSRQQKARRRRPFAMDSTGLEPVTPACRALRAWSDSLRLFRAGDVNTAVRRSFREDGAR